MMTGSDIPIRKQLARLVNEKASRREGTLLLYPDKLAHVHSQAPAWGAGAGFAVILIISFAVFHGGPGALGGLIGAGGGWLIGAAIAKSQAPAKVAAGGQGVTVIPLDSITGLETSKSTGFGGRKSLLVTTADGAEYKLSVKLDSWSADLASALTARGRGVQSTSQGMAVTPAAGE
jgi:hypothetical protein